MNSSFISCPMCFLHCFVAFTMMYKVLFCSNAINQELATFSVNGKVASISSFVGHVVSATTIQICHCSVRLAIIKKQNKTKQR